jgi:3-deoxy-D-manno-octulosonate 8-phosphate phosphatase (KDO 8-P phosphatase)
MDFKAFLPITTFIFDVDGVFTNSEVIVMENGDMLRVMNTRDGQAVRYALDNGYKVCIITKGASLGVKKRFEYLGVVDIYDKLQHKSDAIEDYVLKNKLNKEEMVYMGDDIPDLDVFPHVGISACPYDAVPEVLNVCTYISSKIGGGGCVRELIEKVMRLQGKWPSNLK